MTTSPKNEFPAGANINTLNVLGSRRSPAMSACLLVVGPRLRTLAFSQRGTHRLDSEGPVSSALLRLSGPTARRDYFIFFSYRPSCLPWRRAVPIARCWCRRPSATKRSGSLFSISVPAPCGPMQQPGRAGVIQAAADNTDVQESSGHRIRRLGGPSGRFRRKFSVTGRFALYVGRTTRTRAQGVVRSSDALPAAGQQVGAGRAGTPPIPDHPRLPSWISATKTVRRHGRSRVTNHALLFREPR